MSRRLAVARLVFGALLVVLFLVVFLESAETDNDPVIDCGSPAIYTMLGGGSYPDGRAGDCRTAASEQVLGGGLLFLTPALGLILGPAIRQAGRARRGVARTPVVSRVRAAVGRPSASVSIVEGNDYSLPNPLRSMPRLHDRPPRDRPLRARRIGARATAYVIVGLVALAIATPLASASATGAPISSAGAVQAIIVIGLACAAARPLIERQWRAAALPLRTAFAAVPAVIGFVVAPLSGTTGPYFAGACITLLLLVPVARVRTVD